MKLPLPRHWQKAALTACVFLTGGCYVTDHLLPRVIVCPARKGVGVELPADLRQRDFPVADGIQLRAWEARPADHAPRFAVIVLHGVGDSKATQRDTIRLLARKGYLGIAPDMRAHGDSGGKFATYGYYEKSDLSAIRAILEKENPDLRVGIWGTSYGGAVALQALGNDPQFAFGIIESTFADFPDVVDRYAHNATHLELGFITHRALDRAGTLAGFHPGDVSPEKSAASIRCPLLHMHGEKDRNIPIDHALRIGRCATHCDYRFVKFPEGGHFNLPTSAPELYHAEVRRFLEKHAPPDGPGK